MGSITDVLNALQNGVVALNNLNTQVTGSFNNILGQLATDAKGFLFGLTLSTAGGSATFAVAAGSCSNSTSTLVMTLASAYSKTTAAWAVGTAAGALDTGAIANSTWYHVFIIERVDTGVVDVLISTSATSPTLPTNYTLFRRIGSMKTTGAALWTLFTQDNDEFLWDVPVLDVNAGTGDTVAHTATLTVATGVKVVAKIGTGGVGGAGNDGRFYISSLDQSDQAVATSNINVGFSGAAFQGWGNLQIRTNTSAQVRYRALSASGTIFINTMGWIDARGRLQ